MGTTALDLKSQDKYCEVQGVGLHTGLPCVVQLRPGDRLETEFLVNSSVGHLRSSARWDALSGTARCTALVMRGESRGRAELRTVEHLMSVLMAMGLPGIEVRLLGFEPRDSYELPALDGSSQLWIEPVLQVLGAPQRPPMDYLRVARPFEVQSGASWVRFEPIDSLECQWHCAVDFGAKLQQSKSYTQRWLDLGSSFEVYCKEIAPARTFGFRSELEDLARRGLAKGGSLENALLLDESGLCAGQSYCVESELAAHKLLDAMGDLALATRPLVGRLSFYKAGHAMHLMALKEALHQGVLEASRLQDWI